MLEAMHHKTQVNLGNKKCTLLKNDKILRRKHFCYFEFKRKNQKAVFLFLTTLAPRTTIENAFLPFSLFLTCRDK
jgi:hypothetical protein